MRLPSRNSRGEIVVRGSQASALLERRLRRDVHVVAGLAVRAVGHHTTSRARQQPAARCTAARDAGSTTLHHLVDRDRLEPHPVQAQLVQDRAAPSGGYGQGTEQAAAGCWDALSGRQNAFWTGAVRQADTNPRDRALHRGSITAWTGQEGCAQHETPRTAAPHPGSAPFPSPGVV